MPREFSTSWTNGCQFRLPSERAERFSSAVISPQMKKSFFSAASAPQAKRAVKCATVYVNVSIKIAQVLEQER